MTQAGKEVNRLFKSDFFGERALLVNEPRGATVAATQATVCLVLDRETFTEILGPLDSAMTVRGWRLLRCCWLCMRSTVLLAAMCHVTAGAAGKLGTLAPGCTSSCQHDAQAHTSVT